ncbi:expressed hypothetical protein [Trichoplax adhaerens]|uniref:Cytochrome c oxidase subunit 5B, mitochondrial n=1 Tax=Trichoplax adhaerens TaxID=10228 RepID=B3S274_TRIAD|nr:expressed hypothetical protein [Trichoplax adhaerens]EDV23382.1 expressed hypothetical protein [Trichoplax adhaerens]|eukprot:XP_002114292.1 expressed hypothetical protein [Trichoplax adhaerens]
MGSDHSRVRPVLKPGDEYRGWALLLVIVRAPSGFVLVAHRWAFSFFPIVASDVGVTGRIPSASEQATGKEKFEHDAMMTGNTDPFDMSFHEGPWGTAVNPRGVPSHFDERILGCVCEPEATQIIYMTLKKGNPQQCDCGHWWKLVEAK